MQSIDLEAVSRSARDGDPMAKTAIEEAGEALGAGMSNLQALMDTFPIALVGNGVVLFEFMERSLRDAMKNTSSAMSGESIQIECFEDDRRLVLDGCVITALRQQDLEMAKHRHTSEAAE